MEAATAEQLRRVAAAPRPKRRRRPYSEKKIPLGRGTVSFRPSRTAPWSSSTQRAAASFDWNVASAKPLDWPSALRMTSHDTTEPMPPSRAKSASDVSVQGRFPTKSRGRSRDAGATSPAGAASAYAGASRANARVAVPKRSRAGSKPPNPKGW